MVRHPCFWVGKNLPVNAGAIRDSGLILGLGRSPEGGHGNPLHCSWLENPMDWGAWWAAVHMVAKSWTRLKRPSTHAQVIFMTECFPPGHGRHLREKKTAQKSQLSSFFSCWFFNNCFPKDIMSDVNICHRGNVDCWNQSWVVLMGKILMLNVLKQLKNFINGLGAAFPGGEQMGQDSQPLLKVWLSLLLALTSSSSKVKGLTISNLWSA